MFLSAYVCGRSSPAAKRLISTEIELEGFDDLASQPSVSPDSERLQQYIASWNRRQPVV